MNRPNFIFAWIMSPNIKRSEVKGFLAFYLLFSAIPVLTFLFSDKPVIYGFENLIGGFFGITFTVTLICGILLLAFIKRASLYHIELFFGCASVNICAGLIALSYYNYYVPAPHTYTQSSAFAWITQFIFWGTYIGYDLLMIHTEKKRFDDELKVVDDMIKHSQKKGLLAVSLLAGVLIMVLIIWALRFINKNLFGGIETARTAMLFFGGALFFQFLGGHNFQKIHYMKKYKNHILDEAKDVEVWIDPDNGEVFVPEQSESED